MRPVGADVLVAGAGTTGLTVALQARAHGARVRVVERRREPFRPSRALIVHPRTLEVLRPLGVADALLDRARVTPAVHLHLGRRQVAAAVGRLAVADSPFPHLLIEAQADVEAVLAEAVRAAGVEVERGTELVDVRPAAGGAEAQLRSGRHDEEARFRYVVGCDGPASAVRRAAGIGWRGGPYPEEVVLADLELDGDLIPDVAHAAPAAAGVVFLFPLGEGAPWRLLSTRAAVGRAGPAGQPDGPVPTEELQGLIDGAGLAARVAGVAWSARVALEHRIATAYRAGPLFLAGDAAHVHSPAGGQGMNTGIQDATNIGWKLAFAAAGRSGSAPERLLDSYEAERRPVARKVLALTHLVFWAEAGTGRAPSFVRSRLVPAAAPALPLLLRRRRLTAAGVRVLSQLNVRYGASPLSTRGGSPACHGPGVGTRVADGLVTVGGRRLLLHDLLARPGVHLLLEAGAEPPPAALLGPAVRTHRIEDWPGRGVVAVRPDGYVGYRSGETDTADLRRWLARLGLAGAGDGGPQAKD